jgi:hypothetical protein
MKRPLSAVTVALESDFMVVSRLQAFDLLALLE